MKTYENIMLQAFCDGFDDIINGFFFLELLQELKRWFFFLTKMKRLSWLFFLISYRKQGYKINQRKYYIRYRDMFRET